MDKFDFEKLDVYQKALEFVRFMTYLKKYLIESRNL